MRSLFEEDGLLMKFEEFQGTGEQGKYVSDSLRRMLGLKIDRVD